jgi:hypothetical protein
MRPMLCQQNVENLLFSVSSVISVASSWGLFCSQGTEFFGFGCTALVFRG